MATTETEITVDIDELDRQNADKAAADAKNKAKTDDKDAVTVVKTDAETKIELKAVVTPDEGLEKLKKQLEDERAARLESDRRAQEASDNELRARTEVHGTQLDLVTNAIATVTQANDVLETKYAEALAAQDFAAAAKLNREMSANSAKLLQLENGKAALEKAPKPTARAPIDLVEQFAVKLTPQSAAWVRAHPEFVRDPQKNRAMLAAHELAMARGLQADTPAYFQAVEKTLEIAGDPAANNGGGTHVEVTPADDPMKDAAQPVRRPPPAAAPVTRSGNGAGARPRQVTLSPAQREMARMMFPDSKNPDQEYAQNMVALQNEGKLN